MRHAQLGRSPRILEVFLLSGLLLGACTAEETAAPATDMSGVDAPAAEVTVADAPVTEMPEVDAPEAFSLTDIEWQWTSASGRSEDSPVDVTRPERYTLVFREDGSLFGQADCNTFRGTYTSADGLAPEIALGATTRALCGEDSLDQRYLSVLVS